MSQGAAQSGAGETIAISVHGPVGVLDLVVPVAATSVDVARVYATEAGVAGVPLLQTATGDLLPAGRSLSELGVRPGALMVAATGVHRPSSARLRDVVRGLPDSPALAGFVAACGVAVAGLAAWYAAQAGDEGRRTVVVGMLLACALLACLPIGRHHAQRVVAAPGFAAAAGFAAVYQPGLHLLPTIVAVCAISAATVAAIGRALAERADEALTVWITAGLAIAVVCSTSAVLGWHGQAVWALLLVLAMLAARFVPSLAVNVPDEALLDLDRLAVTAWSARDSREGKGKRGRIVVAAAAMDQLVASASRTVSAGAAAVAVVCTLASPLLLAEADLSLDRIGARCLTFFTGAAVLLAARSYRHARARLLLRVAGLACWFFLAMHFVALDVIPLPGVVVGVAVALGAILVLAAVATGRGWRSVWWARRAEVAESMAGAFALASGVVASGVFRILWEITS